MLYTFAARARSGTQPHFRHTHTEQKRVMTRDVVRYGILLELETAKHASAKTATVKKRVVRDTLFIAADIEIIHDPNRKQQDGLRSCAVSRKVRTNRAVSQTQT